MIALSSDNAERAQAMADKLKAPALRIGHGLPLAVARAMGSVHQHVARQDLDRHRGAGAVFRAGGLYIVRPDGTLYYGAVQTMPFARPHFDELIGALDFAIKNDYPARGEYAGAV